ETGMFSRMRSWVDVAPWVRLARVMRLLASPLYVGIVFVALAITTLLVGEMFLFRTLVGPFGLDWLFGLDAWGAKSTDSGAGPTTWYGQWFVAAMLIFIWTPVMQLTARGGASLVAGRGLPPLSVIAPLIYRRFLKSTLVWIIPPVCILALMFGIYLMRLPAIWFSARWLSVATGWIVGLACLPVGVLGFGACFAIPLGLIAMVTEPDPDPIDSLSRGYEYLFRRPLFLAWYTILGGILLILFGWLFGGLTGVMSVAATQIGSIWVLDAVSIHGAGRVIDLLFLSGLMTLFLASLGGIYLLLRYDAGGQEVEDLWEPAQPAAPQLPTLPREAIGADE
ncbi:MAG: hypothetical protein AAF745_14980, partial [Planctomycetota bacterium]